MSESYLTVKQAAEALQMHRNTIYAMIKSGRLEAIKMGTAKQSNVRILRSSFDKLTKK